MRIAVVTPAGTEEIVHPFVEALRSQNLEVTTHAGCVRDIITSPLWHDTEILVGAGFICGATEFDAASKLRAVVTLTIGFEGIDIDAASARDILVVNGQSAQNYESMAEATILLVLALLYDLPGAQNRLRTARWHVTGLRAQMLKGKTVGIIGFGNIARNVVARLQGWGIRLLVHTRRPKTQDNENIEFVSLETLLSQSDIVVPLTSLNASTTHLLDADRLGAMKQGAFVVNTARGGLIDEQALTRLVQSGRIGGIALDVFETEPLPLNSPLLTLPDAILTPHDLGHTRESTGGMFELGLHNVLALVRGEIPATVINADSVPDWSLAQAGG